MSTTAPVWDIFIAHAGPDAAAAEELFALLAPRTQVYLDTKRLRLGDDWDIALRDAQEKSRVTVVLVSANSGAAYYQREEVASAIARSRAEPGGHRVIPVFLDGFPSGEDRVPYGLRIKHGIALSADVDLADVAERLIELVAEMTPWQPEATTNTRAAGPHYVVECCLCVETGLQLRAHLAEVWDQASSLPFVLAGSMAQLGKPVTVVRTAVMTPVPQLDLPFVWHDLPPDSVGYLDALGRATAIRTPKEGDDLATQLQRALAAPWTRTAERARHHVVVWAGSDPHWPAETLDALADAWEQMAPTAKRLTLLAPDCETWNRIASNLEYAVYYPRPMGAGLTGLQRQEIADLLASSV